MLNSDTRLLLQASSEMSSVNLLLFHLMMTYLCSGIFSACGLAP